MKDENLFCCNHSVTGLIPSFARRGRGGFNYFSKTPPTSPCKREVFAPVTEGIHFA
jgi:hypothetical protein